jgi:hypothetical protein
MLACGEMFEGTIEELKALKVTCPEKFVAPTIAKGQGSANRTETEKEMWSKGRLFGKIYQLVVAESEVNALLNGKTDLSEFSKSEAKDILKAETLEKIEAKCKALNLDYDYLFKCWKYKKEQDKIKAKNTK